MSEQLLFAGIACTLILADQLSKTLVARRLAPGEALGFGPFLRLRNLENVRGPFVLSSNPPLLLALWIILSVAVFWLAWLCSPAGEKLYCVGLGLTWGGATSNLFDRLWRRAIIDFIDLRGWPVFNIADVAIVLGTTSLLAGEVINVAF